jgi:signal transduction histidine kinase
MRGRGRGRSLKAKLFIVIFAAVLLPQVVVGGGAFVTWVQSAGVATGESSGLAGPAGARTPRPLPSGTAWPAKPVEEQQPNAFLGSGTDYLAYVRYRLPAGAYDEMRRLLQDFEGGHYRGGGGGTFALSGPGTPWELPASVLAAVRREGYATGAVELMTDTGGGVSGQVRYVAFRIGRNEGWYDYRTVAQVTWRDRAANSRWWPWTVLAGWLAVNALLALAAALWLNRMIARPVAKVAAASAVLATGGEPRPVVVSRGAPTEVGVLADSFNEMAAKLTRAQEAEHSFLLSVSHELKTPLTAIRGYGETLSEGRGDPKVAGEVVTRESSRLQRLVQDVLDLGRARKTSFSVERGPVDLADVAREAGRRYEPRAAEFGIAVRVEASEPAPAVGDADRVLQIVSNLVENALRCTPEGGEVAIAVRPGEIAVRDTGQGLRGEDLERAFERFYLYERCGEDREVGTGLGLAIVKELAEAMGGSVTVASVLGVGTTFTVALPTA